MQFPTLQELEDAAIAAVPDSDFGGDSWREGLACLLASVRDEGAPNELGIAALRQQAMQFLVNRRAIQRCYRDHPEIDAEEISAPLFSIGMVRTGTTALSYLLEQDPDNRSLLHWQAMSPCPPPETAHLHDDPRIAETAIQMQTPGLSTKEKALIELLPDGPAECLHLLGLDFKSGHFEGMFSVPSYHDWLFSTDLTPAYEWEKKTLKLLQWRAPTKRWMLKYPSHTIALPAIASVFPNARFVATHRDPVKSVTSVCSLVHKGSGMLWQKEDLAYLGRQWTSIVEEQLRRMMAYRESADPSRFIDFHNDDLVRRPMETLEALYDWMGAEITPAARAGFEGRITNNPKGVYGAHSYEPATYGLDVDELRERFRFYTDHYNVRAEN
ncbi:MAG TPA: sulfotransferase [Sphingobium sp.]|nr:sulfotransferase [Sphingobium sp.]